MENYDLMILFKVFGYPISATIFYTWVVMLVCVVASWLATRKLKLENPPKWQTVMEMLVSFLSTEVKEISGDNPKKYLGLIVSFFMFIFVANLLTIFPLYVPPTASLSTTFAFAFVVFCAIPYFNIQNAGVKGYLKKFIDPTPVMLALNIVSEATSCMAMAFRLYGNVLSGVLFSVIIGSFMPFLLPLPFSILGLLTGSIQAYIFALLATVYTSTIAPDEVYLSTTKRRKKWMQSV